MESKSELESELNIDSNFDSDSDYDSYFKEKLKIVTDDNIDLVLLNNYELYIYNYYKPIKNIDINKDNIIDIIKNKNCSLYFATYLLLKIIKYDTIKLYKNLILSPNLTIQDIKKLPINFINDSENIENISMMANLYYNDIIENPQYNFSISCLRLNKNIINNFSYEDCINFFNHFNILYDFKLLFSINKEYTLNEFLEIEKIKCSYNIDSDVFIFCPDYYNYIGSCKFKLTNEKDIKIIRKKFTDYLKLYG